MTTRLDIVAAFERETARKRLWTPDFQRRWEALMGAPGDPPPEGDELTKGLMDLVLDLMGLGGDDAAILAQAAAARAAEEASA